jgi:hypothetical protein
VYCIWEHCLGVAKSVLDRCRLDSLLGSNLYCIQNESIRMLSLLGDLVFIRWWKLDYSGSTFCVWSKSVPGIDEGVQVSSRGSLRIY